MEHIPHAALAVVTSAAEKQGAGNLLRIVLVVLLIGVALTAWFLLRGYRGEGSEEDRQGGGGRRVGDRDGSGSGGTGPAERHPEDVDGGTAPGGDRSRRHGGS